MNRLTLLSCMLCIPTLACHGDDLSVGGASLEREDVEELPAGDAMGTDVSGAYLFTAFEVRACACQAGDAVELCDDITLGFEGIVLAQDGGALELRVFELGQTSDEILLRGGIDADGSLVVGGVSGSFVDGDTVIRVEGNVQPRDGGALVWTQRIRSVVIDTSVDCSVVLDLAVTWWDPDAIASCSLPPDCHPERPHCVDGVCTDGSLGGACTFGDDCVSGICVDEVCSAGMVGDACTFPSDCLSEACVGGTCVGAEDCNATGCEGGQVCFAGACQAGVEGDACETPLHCSPGFRCFEGACQDGSEGDGCGSALDCGGDSLICHLGVCQDGSEGDPCDTATECSVEAPACVDGACRDGSAGDPCNESIDCVSLDCRPDGACA